MKYIASVSFGKDSLAMLLKIIELDLQLDEVIFFDTEMEFSCIYQNMLKISKFLKSKEIKFTRLKADKNFLYMMFDHEIKCRDGSKKTGYKWCGGSCRWFTTYKTNTIKRYLKANYGNEYVEYIGIAADESKRIERHTAKRLILVELGMTELDCLNYCHQKGFNWYEGEYELYDHLDRVSCWCCRNKNLKELKNIYQYFKHYWFALCELENRCNLSMKSKRLIELEKQWKEENK